ncbi:hypothetical protein E5R92_07290 [Candidatus Pelagibacter giovannonii]|uniref:Uncharacterized protein n=1 Tax=Candidatus Pelagibacter giovannonii TaxID=2563896 RepID=A0A6H1Q421_9PROT|nr:hypothetical protein [Candidatus Pelagibacter giovannonii]QIZ21584.1 hypothetical protein E5R92_07290 [Candidatus Pelagibacter giovannonii]
MTRARDIANLLGTNTNGIIDNAKITLDAAEVPNLAASKITSGTFADARIASSNVSQHASSFDDNKIVNDISTLAIRQASNENKGAYNTNSMYVDVFQDSSGIASHTTSARNASEYVSSVVDGDPVHQAISGMAVGGGNIAGVVTSDIDEAKTRAQNGGTGSTSSTTEVYNPFAYTINSSVSGYVIADLGASYVIEKMDIGKGRGHADARSILMKYHATQTDPQANGTAINFTNTTSTIKQYKGSQPNLSNFTSSGTADWAACSTNADGVICTLSGFTPFTARYISYKFGSANFHDNNANWSEFKMYRSNLSVNATGNFISNAITAPSSTSKMGAIVTYQDQAGTNTLNTDIVLQLSADNGSNFTTATMTAMPDFATGIKMAKVNDLTISNAGTQLKYKISFANQSGSKEARIRGVSLQY